MLRVLHLLRAEVEHGCQVVRELLVLECGDGHFCEVYDQVVSDNLIILDVPLELLDLRHHVLHPVRLLAGVLEQALEGELACGHFVYGVLAIAYLCDGLGARGLYSFLAGDRLNQGGELHKLTLHPVPHVLERVLDVFRL